jgi:uncharacterized membrane protein (UPF0127 family)
VSETGRHVFMVDVNLGLRYRHSVDPDGGLLILQSARAPVPMLVSPDGSSPRVDLPLIASDAEPVAAALELADGTITRFGILPGRPCPWPRTRTIGLIGRLRSEVV